MKEESQIVFEKLKKVVETAFLQDHTTEFEDISQWKGQDIANFQEDLFEKTRGTISEKWFYSYFKKETEKLPRIDMLNMLCVYCGYQNWAQFKETHTQSLQTENVTFYKKYELILIPVIFAIVIGAAYLFFPSKNKFSFCFVDDNTNNKITNAIEIIVLRDNESPIYAKTDSNGCFVWETEKEHITAIIKSPYHKTDTINRSISAQGKERIKLVTDDYALMIHYYSTSNIKDWKKRRNHLGNIIHADAVIYQVLDGNIGVELYTKKEFINKLTLPTSSLKNIDVINTKYKDGKIISLKFNIRVDE